MKWLYESFIKNIRDEICHMIKIVKKFINFLLLSIGSSNVLYGQFLLDLWFTYLIIIYNKSIYKIVYINYIIWIKVKIEIKE